MVRTVFFGQLIFGKIITIIVATRGQILRLKCTKFYFGYGSIPHPSGVGGFEGSGRVQASSSSVDV